MNGQLSEHPLGELIREISSKKLSGRLRLQHQQVVVVAYFEDGVFLYAAANVRTLRLGEYLRKNNIVSEEQLESIGDKKSDLQLAAALAAENLADTSVVKSVQLRQQADILRLALLWTEGTWEFDHRSHLNEKVDFKLNVNDLFLEAGRRMPLQFAASRFRNQHELISLNQDSTNPQTLEPTEGFILSRLDQPTPLQELLALSGLSEHDTLRIIYSLALAGYVNRENWHNAFRGESVATRSTDTQPVAAEPQQPVAEQVVDLTGFLERVERATTHYEALAIGDEAAASDIKKAYYDTARVYHPDRFRRDYDESIHSRVEAAFARITQAYEILGDTGSRATYDSKLRAHMKSNQPPPPRTVPPTTTVAPPAETPAQWSQVEVEQQFKNGLAALQRGQTNEAIAFFAVAAKSSPNDARYRAFHGRALAANESTRRRAEGELRAALQLEPENPDYRTMLAELYRDLGFALRARAEAERVLAAAPNHPGARKLLSSLP